MSEPIFGIDLGTTNSCLAVMERGTPRVVEIDGLPTVPSVVSIDPESGEVIVGQRARNRRALYPEATVASIKRRMGETTPVEIHDRSMLPEELSAEILKYLKTEGSKTLGREVRRVVITVPAYFDDAQRRATIRAGELAGLEVVRIINEPTAASLVYERLAQKMVDATAPGEQTSGDAGDESSGASTVLVYDLGGGTFDVSVVRLDAEVYEVLASCGNTQLGGDDLDQLLVEHLLAEIEEAHETDLGEDVRAVARLRDAAEQAKISLSSQPFVTIMEEALSRSIDLEHELERHTFESLIRALLGTTLDEVSRALAEANLRPDDLDRVILVGGSTRIPMVLRLLEDRLGRPVEHSLDPDLCVALGAAVQGAVLAGEAFDRILIDVSAHSLGIRSLKILYHGLKEDDDQFTTIIPRNTQIPVTRSEVFYTIDDDQDHVRIAVYQGEASHCTDNTLIGEFMTDLLPAPARSQLVVELSYDLEGIIHVVVDQKGTDNRAEVTMNSREQGRVEVVDGNLDDTGDQIDNFVIRKARRLAGLVDEAGLGEQLLELASDYATALGDDSLSAEEIDGLEDRLVDLIEEAEELVEDEQEA